MDIKLFKLEGNAEKLNLLKIIRKLGKVTRGQIVDLTGYSSGKISLLIKELEEHNLIEESGENDSTGGRKPKLLQLKGEIGYFIGVELGGYELKISLIDFCGKKIAMDKTLQDTNTTEPGAVIDKLVKFINEFINSNEIYRPLLKGLGLALSGIVDDETGGCKYFKNQNSWEGIPLRDILEKTFPFPCVIDDSSRMMAVSEKIYGGCRNVDNFIAISIGVGLGAGIFINGRLFRGSNGFGGEIGHMIVKENGPRCVCGNYGCLESLVSGYAIERELKYALKDNVISSLSTESKVTAKEVVEQAGKGDKLAYSIINNAAKYLGIGLANVINIFNPQMVVLAGGVSKAGEMLLEPIEHVVKSSALGFTARNCKIVISQLDEYAASIGIANTCIDRLLSNEKAAAAILI